VLYRDTSRLKSDHSGMSLQIFDIDHSLSTDHPIQLFIVEHEQPIFGNERSQPFANELCLELKQLVDFVRSQLRNVQLFVGTENSEKYLTL
jgi:hypothetical protein